MQTLSTCSTRQTHFINHAVEENCLCTLHVLCEIVGPALSALIGRPNNLVISFASADLTKGSDTSLAKPVQISGRG